MSRGIVRAIIGLSCVLLLCAWLFVFGDLPGAWTRTGPYHGKVLDAETGRPVPDAYVVFSWSGSGLGGGIPCAGNHLVRTSSDGTYQSAWQGHRYLFTLGLTRLAPPTVSVLAAGFRPWGVASDGPTYPADASFVPQDSGPFAPREVGTISLTRMHGTTYSDEDWRHLANCVGNSDQEREIVRYIWMRARWESLCGVGQTSDASAADFEKLAEGFADALPVRLQSEPRDLAMGEVRAKLAATLDPAHMKPVGQPRLTEGSKAEACALTNVRVPTIEDYGR